MKPKQGDSIVVWFSCGTASAIAAKKTIELYGDTCNVRIVNTPIIEEHVDNRRFAADVEKWLGVKIESAINSKYPESSCVKVWNDRKYMSGKDGAPCTLVLKKQARYEFEKDNKIDWHVLGFTADEKHRHDKFIKSEKENVLPVLIDLGINKIDCFEILTRAGIELPLVYKLGFYNANCIGCVKATSPTYWNHVRNIFPEVFEARAKQSRDIGCKLTRVKGKRIFLDELPESAKGRSMKAISWECGIFCKPENIK